MAVWSFFFRQQRRNNGTTKRKRRRRQWNGLAEKAKATRFNLKIVCWVFGFCCVSFHLLCWRVVQTLCHETGYAKINANPFLTVCFFPFALNQGWIKYCRWRCYTTEQRERECSQSKNVYMCTVLFWGTAPLPEWMVAWLA